MRTFPNSRLCSVLWLLCLLSSRCLLQAQTQANDNLADAKLLNGTDVTDSVANDKAKAETGEPAHAGYAATHSVWWTWTAPTQGEVIIDLKGSFNGALIEVYTGKYLNELVSVGSNAFGNTDGTGRIRLAVESGKTYQIVADTYPGGAVGLIRLHLRFAATGFEPELAGQPADVDAVERRDSPMFSVEVRSATPVTYQWRFNGADIPGATSQTLTLPVVRQDQAGLYSVVATNEGGKVESRKAVVVVHARPLNDDFADRIALAEENNLRVLGHNLYATRQDAGGETGSGPSGGDNNTVWWTWTAPAPGPVVLDCLTSYAADRAEVFTGLALPSLTPVAASYGSNPDGTGKARFVAVAGTTYVLRVGSNDGSGGPVRFTLKQVDEPPSPATNVVKGQVTDAIDGHNLSGVAVSIQGKTVFTDTGGNYLIAGVVPNGFSADFDADIRRGIAPHTVHFSSRLTTNSLLLNAVTNGYAPYRNTDLVIVSNEPVSLSFSMSPILDPGAMRLVLNWGTQPRDLDVHLLTPAIAGTRHHIFYPPGSRGNLAAPPFASLDIDRTNGLGPETISIKQLNAGTYRCFVRKFDGVGGLAGSGATIKIYTEAGEVQSVIVPTTGTGTFWHVCDIDGATRALTVVNRLSETQPATPTAQEVPLAGPKATRNRGAPASPPTDASYAWDFGDGTSSTEADPVKIYNRPGTFTVGLTVVTSGRTNWVVKPDFITVLSVNTRPTLDPIGDLTVLEDAPAKTIDLTGITTGATDELQKLTVTAASDNSALILPPVVAYTSPRATGTLSFRPVADASGIATITVTVKDDGGTANGGQDTIIRQFKVTVTPVNDPPTVALTAPLEGAVFASGNSISLTATAADIDGQVARVEFFDGAAKIGEDLRAPYTFTWTAASVGGHTLTAKATDDGGATATSAAIHVTVTSVANTAPTVRLTSPGDGQVYVVGSPISIEAEAADKEGPVAKVEFFREGGIRLGTDTAAPYQIPVADLAEGPHTLTAVATDPQGLATTSVAVRIDVVGEPRDVAVIRASEDSDFDRLTEALTEVHLPGQVDGLTWRSFTRSALSFDVLYRYRLVVWDDPAPSRTVDAGEIALLRRLHDVGIPLYFLGPRLRAAADPLSPDLQAQWQDLVHLQKATGTVSGRSVELVGADEHTAILNGTYGAVGPFQVGAAVADSRATADADPVGRLGTADVLLSHPALTAADSGIARSFTQTVPLAAAGDEASVTERKLLFKNAVCWLLDCIRCAVINIAVLEDEVLYEPAPPRTGELLKWTPVIAQTAECPATGVSAEIRLAAGLQFIGATTPQGEVSETDGIVTFRLGRLSVARPVAVELLLRPLAPGFQTNHFDFRANGLDSKTPKTFSQDIVFEVVGDPLPLLSIDQVAADKVRLKVVAQPGSSYVLERSADPAAAGPLGWTPVTTFVFALPSFITTEIIPAGSSSAFYRVRKR